MSMKSFTCIPRLARKALLALALVGHAAFAGPPPWPDAPYSYFADNQRLEAVLGDFATSFSLALSLQPGVGGAVNGRFTAKNPTEFISRLGGVYGFTWYTYAGTLYVSKTSDMVMRSIPMPERGLGNVKQALTQLGLIEPRFGWGELPEQGIVIVSGPVSYVAQVEATLRQLPASSTTQQVRVFRLKHASAEDRVILYRDRQITQPGLASVLRQALGGRGSIGGGSTNELTPPAAQPSPLRPAPTLGMGAEPAPGGPAAPGGAGPGLPGGGTAPQPGSAAGMQVSADPRLRVPSIQSDPRLNALIIQDQPERMPIYERLIAQLDIPSALIEIEAMIIDINTERARELGINWALQSGNTSIGFGVPGSLSGPGALSLTHGTGGATTLVAGAGAQLISQIRLLETKGDARIQSRPSVLTTDNIGALLDLSETFYVRVQGERVANVSPITAGTTLRVTPRLVQDGVPQIQLTIDIEDGQIQDRQIDSLPTVRRSTVSTQAVVNQDETLLIAGYSADQNIDSDQKVPVLGDLPGVGLLFSNKTRMVQKRERLFMIRPRLVVPVPAGAAAAGAPVNAAAAAVPDAPAPLPGDGRVAGGD